MIYLVDKLPKHPNKKYGKRRLDQIKYIVIHHFASNATIEEAAKYHISKGWPGIGYTVVIDGRKAYMTNDLDTVCYGVANNNTRCLSISVRGNYENKFPDDITLDVLRYKIDTLRGILGPLEVKVHSDFVNTNCPGKLKEWVKVNYPSPEPLTIPVSKLGRWWKKLFRRDPDHPEMT